MVRYSTRNVNIVILLNFVVMEFGREPDIIKNSLQSAEEEFGPNLIRLRVTQQIKELQTVIRDKCVCLPDACFINQSINQWQRTGHMRWGRFFASGGDFSPVNFAPTAILF